MLFMYMLTEEFYQEVKQILIRYTWVTMKHLVAGRQAVKEGERWFLDYDALTRLFWVVIAFVYSLASL